MSGELARARSRHAAFALALAEQLTPRLRDADPKPWLGRLEREAGNLRAALDRGRAQPAGGPFLLRLAAALHWFWFLHSLNNLAMNASNRGCPSRHGIFPRSLAQCTMALEQPE
ncbi:MAG: hypothetical protein HYX51_11610 [Chloroflexi bacterium]|nr:hypothetical protein [Chloroflexota bacterium]